MYIFAQFFDSKNIKIKLKIMNRTDEQFLSQANTINEQCSAHATEWKLSEERVHQLNMLIQNANVAYAANSDHANRNLITSTNKKAAFDELQHFLSLFIVYLKGNTDVPDDAIEIMGLPSRTRHAHEPLSAPTDAPVVSIVRRHNEITVHVSQPKHGHPTHSTKPKKYYGFKLRIKIEGEAESRLELSTRLRYTVRFNSGDEGKRITLSAAWLNRRLESGPWSNDISDVIG
jgi:hypothetical protein